MSDSEETVLIIEPLCSPEILIAVLGLLRSTIESCCGRPAFLKINAWLEFCESLYSWESTAFLNTAGGCERGCGVERFMSMPKTLGTKPSKLHCDLGQARDRSLLTIINAPDSANFWALDLPLLSSM